MKLDELQQWVKSTLEEAISFIDDDVSPHRAEATRYFLGHPFAESDHTPIEQEGRSQIVSRELHDAVNAVLPALMRIYFGNEKSIQFIPRTSQDVEMAEQASDYVNFLFRDLNPGYRISLDVLQDALVKGVGIAEVTWSEDRQLTTRELSGLDGQTVDALTKQDEWEIVNVMPQDDGTFDVDLSKEDDKGKVLIESIPPEELLINRTATSADDCKLIARRQYAKVGDLISMGYDYDLLKDHAGPDDTYKSNEEYALRHPTYREEDSTDSDPANYEVLYIETYAQVDADGDGRRELRRICTVGNTYDIVRNEAVEEHPFVIFRMAPMPHSWDGTSLYDEVGDLQRIKSAVLRNMLDSLALSVNPRIQYLESQVDYEDLSQSEVGSLIPVRQMGAVQALTVPYVGREAQSMLDYIDQLKESRTGISRASQGLSGESLQSTTAIAVDAQQRAAQARLELIARNLAETGFRPLFEKILRLVTYHQQAEQVYELRGQYIPVDPTRFPKMSARVSLPMGGSDTAKKVATLQTVLAEQEKVMTLLGVQNNPLTSLQQWRETMLRMLELQGIHDGAKLWNDPATMPPQQQPPQEPEKSPEQILAEAEVQRKRMDVMQRGVEMRREDDRKRDEMEIDLFLKIKELEAKYGQMIDPTPVFQMIERNREISKLQEQAQTNQAQQQMQQPQPMMQSAN